MLTLVAYFPCIRSKHVQNNVSNYLQIGFIRFISVYGIMHFSRAYSLHDIISIKYVHHMVNRLSDKETGKILCYSLDVIRLQFTHKH